MPDPEALRHWLAGVISRLGRSVGWGVGGSLIGRPAGGRVGRMALCERDRDLLDTERTWWLDGRSKTEVVRSRLRVSLSRYNQMLMGLLANKEAEDYDPLTVRRLRRARERRRWAMMGVRPAGDRHRR